MLNVLRKEAQKTIVLIYALCTIAISVINPVRSCTSVRCVRFHIIKNALIIRKLEPLDKV